MLSVSCLRDKTLSKGKAESDLDLLFDLTVDLDMSYKSIMWK